MSDFGGARSKGGGAPEIRCYFEIMGSSVKLNKVGSDSNSARRRCLRIAVSCSTKSAGGKGDPSFSSGKFINPRMTG